MFLLMAGCVVLAMLGYSSIWKKLTASRARAGARSPPSPQGASPGPAPPAPAEPAVDPAVARLAQTITDALAVLRDPNNANKKAALTPCANAPACASEGCLPGHPAVSGRRGGRQDRPGFQGGRGRRARRSARRCGRFSWTNSARSAATLARATPPRKPASTLQANTSPDESALAMRNLAWADPTARNRCSPPPNAPCSQLRVASNTHGRVPGSVRRGGLRRGASLLAESPTWARRPRPCSGRRLWPWNGSARSRRGRWDYLNAHPDILADRPLLRADYVGNVDLSDAGQRTQAEMYLQRRT